MSGEQIRQPAVAGQFYEGTAERLVQQIEQCYLHELGPGRLPVVNEQGPREIVGLISPHAGYVYSGPTAAVGFSELADDGRPEVAVVIGVNHGHALGSAVQTAGAWRTPLGDLPIATEVAEAIAGALPSFATEARAFGGEHSLEVQLPFLQHLYDSRVRLVPIMLGGHGFRAAETVGRAVAEALQGRDAVIIASTDMTHYEPPQVAARQDALLIERIEAMDPEGLVRERDSRGISMCGAGPVAAALVACKLLGATAARKLAYSTSGDVLPSHSVVGYLSAKIVR
jgi:AmmeMemoRadiSam system protein B